ncbi:MAG: sigma 54-interacting transcriptional regulator [Desulfitobacterium sp.]|nr:sigma 54-interacting transcriptional regulator [Desulfitobacterium sp.]
MLLREGTNTRFFCLSPGDKIEKAVKIFLELKIAIIPVLDEEGRLLSIFSRSSLYRAILNGATYKDVIDPYLITDVKSISDDSTDEEVASFVKSSSVGSVPVLDKDNKVIGLLCKARMVMTLFRHSEFLNVQLKAILDSLHNGVIVVDSKGKVTHINIGASRILNIEPKLYLGKPSQELLPNLDLSSSLKQGVVKIGIKYQHNGINMVVNITPLNIEGKISGGIIVFQDLTDLEHTAKELETVKALNKTFETVLNIIGDGIVVIDEEGKTTLVNQAMADFLTHPKNEIIGKPISEIMTSSQLENVVKTGVAKSSEVITIQGKPLVVSNSPIIKEGNVVGAVGKAVFPHLAEAQELAEKVRCLEHKVSFFQEELQKSMTVQDIMKDMIAESPQMKRLKDEISLVASSISTVLITGESGTGKEVVAHAIHLCSNRSKGPFIKVNCAAIPENLMESEMFGYVGGAFTGAAKEGKPGRIERADGGTLFLDEIGEMPLSLQAKLLRVIQDREIERLGSTESKKVDIRIIAATNKKMNKAIAKGEFRQDLFYRLNVINLHLPPLRERIEDIEPLTNFFIKKFNRILKANVTGITDSAMSSLIKHSWPGNIRELENVIERAVNFTRSGLIELIHLPSQILRSNPNLNKVVNNELSHQERIAIIEREMIIEALEKTGGNKTRAAKLLNLSRSRLYDKINKYNLK